MLFEMCGTFLHTVTVIRFPDGSINIDRTVLEEVNQIQQWFKEGELGFDLERNMFVINGTGYTATLSKGINVAYITWYRERPWPFFGSRDISEWAGCTPMPQSCMGCWNIEPEGILRRLGDRTPDHKFEDFVKEHSGPKPRPNPDADPSIPDELEVEKDEQPKVIEKNWPSFMPGGVYNRELHIANCNELSQIYPCAQVELRLSSGPSTWRMPNLFLSDGSLNEALLQERRTRLHDAVKSLNNSFSDRVGGWLSLNIWPRKTKLDPISEQMLKAHEPEHLVDIIDPRDELVQPSYKQFEMLDSMVSRYVTLIKQHRDNADFGHDFFGDKTSLAHLLGMAGIINSRDVKMTIGRRQRWLGYVQGILTAYRLITVDTERDATRGILNGQ